MPGFTNAVEAGKAFVAFGVQDNTSIGLRRISARFRQFGASLQFAGAQLFAGGIIAAAPLASAFKAFEDLEESMQFLKAITEDVDGSFGRLEQTIRRLGATTSFTAKEVAEGAIALGRAGFSQSEIAKALPQILALSRATRTDLALSADIAAVAMRSFGLEAEDMGHIVNTLTAAANSSAQTLEDFFEGFKLAAPLAKSLGDNIDQLSIKLAVLADAGIKGSIAGTGLRRAFINLSKASGQAKVDKFIGEIRDGTGQMITQIQMLRQLEERIKNLDSVARAGVYADIFGRGANTMLILADSLREGTAASQEFLSAYDEQADAVLNGKSATDTAAEALDSLWGQVKLLTSAFTELKLAIVETVGQELEASVKALKTLTDSVAEFIRNNKQVVITWAKVTAAMLAAAAILVPLGAAFVLLGTSISLVVGFLGSLVTVGGVVIGILVGLVGHIGTLVTIMGGWAATIGGALLPLLQTLGWYIVSVVSSLTALESVVAFAGFATGLSKIGGIASSVFGSIMRLLADIGQSFLVTGRDFIRPFTDFITGIGEAWNRSSAIILELLKNGDMEAATAVLLGELSFLFANFWTNIEAGWNTFLAALWNPFAVFGERIYDTWLELKNFILETLHEISNAANFVTFGAIGTDAPFQRSAVDQLAANTNTSRQLLNEPRRQADAELAARRRVWEAELAAIQEQAAERARIRQEEAALAKQQIEDETKAREDANAKLTDIQRGSLRALETVEEQRAAKQKARDRELKLNALNLRREQLLLDQQRAAADEARISAVTAAPSGADIRTAAGFQALLPLANRFQEAVKNVELAVREELLASRQLQQQLLEVENRILKLQEEEADGQIIFDDGDAASDPDF